MLHARFSLNRGELVNPDVLAAGNVLGRVSVNVDRGREDSGARLEVGEVCQA
jgi:hypothetical protein